MGVPDLWDIVSPAVKQRLPLSVFASDFQKKHNRSMRIAIDSFQWIYETAHIPNSNGQHNPYRVIQGFLSRIWYLVSCNISFVIVFDGNLKPSFKNGVVLRDKSNLENFEELYEHSGFSSGLNSTKEQLLKRTLTNLNIAYVEAAGEAESECSRLQNLGVVDYVLSNDSDTMLFGADKILKNFSRNYESSDQDEYYVDPVELEEFYEENGIDRVRLIFFAVLRGADYNSGLNKVGTERARRVAFCGTKLSKAAESCTDFHDQFREIFYQDNFLRVLPDSANVESRYREFIQSVEQEVSSNLVAYFGRKDILKLDEIPLYYIALLYFYPILTPPIFMFTPSKLNYRESIIEEHIRMDQNTIPQLNSLEVVLGNCVKFKRSGGGAVGIIGVSKYNLADNSIQFFEIPHQKENPIDLATLIKDLDEKLPNVISTKNHILSNFVRCMIPYFLSSSNNEGIYLKSWKIKVLPSRAEIGHRVRMDYESESNLLSKWVIKMYLFKYHPALLLKNHFPSFANSFDEFDADYEDKIWISEQMMLNLNLTHYIDNFERKRAEAKVQSRPQLKAQSSTLDSLGFLPANLHLSPHKSPRKPVRSHSLRRNSSSLQSPSKVNKAPMKSPRKSPRKSPKKLAVGQSTITNFFEFNKQSKVEDSNVMSLDDVDNDEAMIHDILNTPSKKVPISYEWESPIKKEVGVKKLFVDEEEREFGELRHLNVLDRIILESKLSDSSDSE